MRAQLPSDNSVKYVVRSKPEVGLSDDFVGCDLGPGSVRHYGGPG